MLRSAGASPNRSPVKAAAATVRARTLASGSALITIDENWLVVTNAAKALAPQYASRMPRPAPANDRSTLSVKSCRASRPRPAPSPSRTAISFSLAVARESINPATFAQEITSRIPTAAIKIHRGFPNCPRIPDKPCCAGITATRGSSSTLNCFSWMLSLRNNELTLASACSREMPVLSRPTIVSHKPVFSLSGLGPQGIRKGRNCDSGSHISCECPGVSRVNPASATPTMVNGTPFNLMDFPIALGAPPKALCQYA